MNDTSHQADETVLSPVPADVKAAPTIGVMEKGHAEVTAVGAMTLDGHHANFAEFQESYVRHYIGLADTKAAWTFAIASGVLVYLFGQSNVRRGLLSPALSLDYALLAASVLSLCLSAFFAFRVVAPRLSSPSAEGIVFFGAVAEKGSAALYVGEVAQRKPADLTAARLKHCYDVSSVCSKKYASLKKSIWFGLPGLALALLYMLTQAA
ncbi:Pycsar system effector family protein [Altererythrobacter sp. C41]|uniref:Pycsar system effector family protein n=1 Tax=Altererythrobacter sp. C41 TaxID=2806021 RepID=UPI0019349AAF|nr:Pycsar system effector family protein [Altererythrobacter sp. C41]MBM0169512.1 hypothetical protein [Altererythrobacter sp. C41]